MLSLRTVSGRRYRVDGRLPSPREEAFHRRLHERRFLPLSRRGEQAHGWVCADNLLLTQFDADTVLRGDHAVFALRVDRRRPNARVLRAQIDLELRGRRKAAEDAGRRWRPSREERRDIRVGLEEALLRETNPSIQICTVVLRAKHRVLYALTLGRRLSDLVAATFRETFDVGLTPLTPWHRGREILAGSASTAPLAGLERARFTAPPLPEDARRPARLLAEPAPGAEAEA